MNNEIKSLVGLVFNIQHFSVHDGIGIRTVVFMKGCSLRCQWCSNPESQNQYPELGYNAEKCIGCCRCIQNSSSNFMVRDDDGAMIFSPEKVTEEDLRCAELCPPKALIRYGTMETVPHLLDIVEQDAIFYARSGGGLTLSGGEALCQPEFAIALLEAAHSHRLHTAMETCGAVKTTVCLKAVSLLDELFYDIKHLDSAKHKVATGAGNELILHNIKAIREAFPGLNITVRTPVIPGFNDTEEEITAIASFVRDHVPGAEYELLPYHNFGTPKYRYLQQKYDLGEQNQDPEVFQQLKLLSENILARKI